MTIGRVCTSLASLMGASPGLGPLLIAIPPLALGRAPRKLSLRSRGKARRDRRLALALMAGDDLPGRRNAGLAASFGECIPEPLAVIAAIGEKCLPEASC
jgi:hypothetical protein